MDGKEVRRIEGSGVSFAEDDAGRQIKPRKRSPRRPQHGFRDIQSVEPGPRYGHIELVAAHDKKAAPSWWISIAPKLIPQ
jgi:hypothetical protein